MTSMKLQKLVYYSQAWTIVWADDVLFIDPIEAWDNGPVVRDLWVANKGTFRISEIPDGDSDKLSPEQKLNIDSVLNFYGDKDAQWLSDLTHMERPWREAFEQGRNTQLDLETISEYYSSIEPEVEAAGAG
ncbi:Panacea domain-containing protein [Paramylibacter kogurei]|nr:type II toxin-antitoxin system antitoxin SocA domain-containing protein [Amylibacter kogurei]